MDNKQREESLTLELLEAIDERSDLTQRHLARHMGIALGLANSYLKRCVRKGLVKIQEAPANRYLYYLTPQGFAEKSRLTAQYLSFSFSFYRKAGESCAIALQGCRQRGWTRIMLCGASDLAEIASLRALEHELEILGVFDAQSPRRRFLNLKLFRTLDDAGADAWLLTDMTDPQAAYRYLASWLPEGRIVVPGILGLRIGG